MEKIRNRKGWKKERWNGNGIGRDGIRKDGMKDESMNGNGWDSQGRKDGEGEVETEKDMMDKDGREKKWEGME